MPQHITNPMRFDNKTLLQFLWEETAGIQENIKDYESGALEKVRRKKGHLKSVPLFTQGQLVRFDSKQFKKVILNTAHIDSPDYIKVTLTNEISGTKRSALIYVTLKRIVERLKLSLSDPDDMRAVRDRLNKFHKMRLVKRLRIHYRVNQESGQAKDPGLKYDRETPGWAWCVTKRGEDKLIRTRMLSTKGAESQRLQFKKDMISSLLKKDITPLLSILRENSDLREAVLEWAGERGYISAKPKSESIGSGRRESRVKILPSVKNAISLLSPEKQSAILGMIEKRVEIGMRMGIPVEEINLRILDNMLKQLNREELKLKREELPVFEADEKTEEEIAATEKKAKEIAKKLTEQETRKRAKKYVPPPTKFSGFTKFAKPTDAEPPIDKEVIKDVKVTVVEPKSLPAPVDRDIIPREKKISREEDIVDTDFTTIKMPMKEDEEPEPLPVDDDIDSKKKPQQPPVDEDIDLDDDDLTEEEEDIEL